MPYIAVAEENSGPIELYYEDHGAGPAVVLVHGFASSSRSWEKQVVALYLGGFRVVAYDRRGFGQSSMPAFGYDFDTLATDLHVLIATLELRDIALVGFGMGGGEVARYFGRYGAKGVGRAAFISSITPAPCMSPENPHGIDAITLERMRSEIAVDRFAFTRRFIADVYGRDGEFGSRASHDVLERDAAIAASASPFAMDGTVAGWCEDFRSDLARVDVPTLVVHGDSDRIAPLATTAQRMPEHLHTSTLNVLEGAPHGLIWTHAAPLNAALLQFLR
jgi:non-heme chloroperoxidase